MSIQPSVLSVYDQPHQFEPLLPSMQLGELVEATRRIFERSAALQAYASTDARASLREIVRSMNSYYSNRIEGQGTHPANIERALRSDFSDRPDVASGQRIALAHIEAEKELEPTIQSEAATLGSTFLRRAHASLYSRLVPEDRTTADGRVVMPGELRTHDVSVGRHQPPTWQSVPLFLDRMDAVYGRLRGMDALVYTIAASHHRMAWTHPFEDGNGRAIRLQTHCALLPMNGGLWSVNRGLARQRERYYQMLDNADSARQGDLDGRGNLSQKMLWQWCRYFVDMCEDQAGFMEGLLDLGKLKGRLRAYVMVKGTTEGIAEYRDEAVLPLQTAAVAGAVSRGDFIRMTGLHERTGRKIIARFLDDGLLRSTGHRAELRIAFPMSCLAIVLPNLYPEASTVPVD